MKTLALALCLTLSLFSLTLSAKTLTEAQYIEVFQGEDIQQQKDALASLVMAGMSEPKVYNKIEENLQKSLPLAVDRHSIDYSAWLLKGLAYSGDEKYIATFNAVIAGDYHSKLQKYARKSLKILDQYKVWAPILSNKSLYDDKFSQASNVLANALRSDVLELKLNAAKRVINQNIDSEQINEVLNEELKDTRLLKHEKQSIQAYAYMAKALAITGDEKYKPTIEQLAQDSSEKKLRKYASKYLKKYY
ncbi:hypothetical protein FM038_023710 [Shewanella eurypsychrophilus]|uniref:Uncharacterized protein n=1 Tax=Shewanella eurypsychrophilus TaxID=2593656 RepID=A0ABX6VDS8_9GAMM|nr:MULTISPECIES: hypothetical protein [Shewanella]QFU24838.1 hypothetical protein FS418_25365 [Shewanella sp. YLB-09]QPG60027.1 hypothetical protein FM038_023710 [Shewanella eurypsychrophilus]